MKTGTAPKLIWTLAVLSAFTSFAEVKPAGIFSDYAILQQGEPVRIWGTAAAGEAVKVTFAEQTLETKADTNGDWMVTLNNLKVCAEGRSLIFQGSETAQPVELKEILVGEVWMAGGQSNMEWPMNNFKKTTQPDIASANDPLLRMAHIPRLEFAGQNDDRPQWKKSTSQNVAGFSACAYYFAKNLRSTLNVPVGVVVCAVGGSPAEAWMSRKTLESNADIKKVLDAYEKICRKNFLNEEDCLKQGEEYEQARKAWYIKHADSEPRPMPKMGPHHFQRPYGLHDAMLSQTIPYTVRGVIWYQGENNSAYGFHYRTVFSALIKEWREEYQNPELPFLFAQLATFGPPSDWTELRESQSWVEAHVKNTGMAVLVDGGEEKNIHPHSKDKAGLRLSLLARNMVYGEKDLVCHGPRLKEAVRKDGSVELTFQDADSGLILKPEAVSAFEICGKDGKYVPAKAEQAGNRIIISAESVPEPQYVRYGWKQWFVPTLFNAEGLPASPFRTDDFPPVTKDRYLLDRS
ncbi:MAG: hypothetical protein HOO88_08475 [Kiritimatiellaceae bacterium]|nr:hypothetical protein [Kiritimatiellaceae bacterium]